MNDKESSLEDAGPSASTSYVVNQHENTREHYPISHPKHIIQRVIALILMCFIGFGSYFCYDNPGALQIHFKQDMSLSNFQTMYLYSWYSWPNVIWCFIGGFLIDRVFGIRFGTILYAGAVVIGQLVFATGAYMNLFWLAVFGRFIFGLGGEPLAVAQNNYAVLWFKGNVLNMVFGFQLSFARFGSTVNFLLMEPMYEFVSKYYSGYQCLGVTLFLASATCVLSLVCGLLLGWQDRHAQRILNVNTVEQPTTVVKLSDVKNFSASFWLITVTIVFYYGSTFSFIAIGTNFFMTKYKLSPHEANVLMSLIYMMSTVLSPIMGIIVDKIGRNMFFVFSSLLLNILAYAMLAFTSLPPIVCMGILGLTYSMIASALWPLIALVIHEHQLGTAYGAAQSIQNLGMALISMLSGHLVDQYGYFILLMSQITSYTVALLSILIAWLYDKQHTGILNMNTSQRKEYERSLKSMHEAEERKLLLNQDDLNDEHEESSKTFDNDSTNVRSF